jgi:hypothetical protein
MKTKLVRLLLIVFTVCGIVGCVKVGEGSDRYTLTVNHDVPACGIKDPTVNIPWLADKCMSIALSIDDFDDACSINVYKNKTTDENRIAFYYHGVHSADGGHIEVYTCAGDSLFSYPEFAPVTVEQQAFMDEYEFAGRIWDIESILPLPM